MLLKGDFTYFWTEHSSELISDRISDWFDWLSMVRYVYKIPHLTYLTYSLLESYHAVPRKSHFCPVCPSVSRQRISISVAEQMCLGLSSKDRYVKHHRRVQERTVCGRLCTHPTAGGPAHTFFFFIFIPPPAPSFLLSSSRGDPKM